MYESDVIRINSQSGKGGIGYVLETRFGYNLPKKMREAVGYLVKGVSDRLHKEMLPDEVYAVFWEHYVDLTEPLNVTETHFVQHHGIEATIGLTYHGETSSATNTGNGRLDAVSKALKQSPYTFDYKFITYSEHALSADSHSKAASYICIEDAEGRTFWGVGTHEDIILASVNALVSALNRMNRKDHFVE